MADWVPTSLSRLLSGHGPRIGPNMLRPMIQAPIFSIELGDVIVDAGGAARLADHFMKHPRLPHPGGYFAAIDAERMLKALAVAGKPSSDTEKAEALTFPICVSLCS